MVQVMSLLRLVEVAVASGRTTALACKEAPIIEVTYYCWRNEYGCLQVNQGRLSNELEQEIAKLQRLVAEMSLSDSTVR